MIDVSKHSIDVTRGAELRAIRQQNPGWREDEARIKACGVKRTRRRLDIMSMLATGWLPWGTRWDHNGDAPCLPLSPRSRRDFRPALRAEYIMCCGHVMKPAEAQQFVDAGLLMAGAPDKHGRATLVITEAGKCWLEINWH